MQKDPHKVDDLLRQRLAALPIAPPSDAGWERLDNELAKDPDFALRSALVGLATNERAAGWEALERKLDPLTTSDAELAAKLNALAPDAPAGSWAMLSDKIDDAFGREVDAVVSQQLAQQTAQPSSGWAALAARLELISHRRHLVGAWKVTELSLLLSFLLLFIRFGGDWIEEHPVLALSSQSFPLVEVVEAPATAAAPSLPIAPVLLPADAPVAVVDEGQRVSQAADKTIVPVTESRKAEVIAPLPVVDYTVLPPVSNSEKPEVSLGLRPQHKSPLIGADYAVNWSTTLPSPALVLPTIDNSVPVRYRLNLFLAPGEINEVITPQSAVNNIDVAGRNQYSHSSSVGALLDISKGKDGMEIGAIYSFHSYTPTELIGTNCIVTGNCPEGYDRFIYHSISFPFAYERTLYSRNDWRIGARVGMALSVITQSEFQLSEADFEYLENSLLDHSTNNFTGNGNAGGGRSNQPVIQARQILDPEPGWFEGGSLLANASFYLSGGVMVERFLTPRFSLYVSPTYSRVIFLRDSQGIGPYNDRIHRASLRFGSRFLLGGK